MTITSLPERELHLLWEDAAPVLDATHQAPRSRWWLRVWRNEIFLLTLVALAGYIAAALWIRFGLHFFVNDALTRSADAVYVTVGRDPHLAAIGFYWPPLAQLVQLPISPIVVRFGYGILAGPLSSAICMALTIPVLARIGRFAGLRRGTTFAICATFAVNPVTIYYAGIGMSEACSILFIAVALLGFLKYTREPSTQHIILFSAGLCGVIMTRLEGPFLTFALVVVAVIDLRHLKRSLWNAVLIAGPPYAMFALWLLAQWIIEKDPLFFMHQSGGAPPPAGSVPWLPDTSAHPLSAIPWAAQWLIVLGPAIVIVAVTIIVRPLSWKTRGSVGLVGGCLVFPVIQIYQVITGTGFGNPRYFVTAIVFATVGVLWIASSPRRELSATVGWSWSMRSTRGFVLSAWNVGLIALLLVSAGVGSRTLTSGKVTHVEGECAFFQYGVAQLLPFLGTPQHGTFACKHPGNLMRPWRLADRYLDSHVKPTDRILADNSINFPADLFTTKPQLFIVENDRDWQKIVANPREVTYIVTQSATPRGRPAATNPDLGGSTDMGAQIISYTPDEWHLVATFPGANNVAGKGTAVQVYRFVPSAPGNVPQGTESDISG